MRMERVKKKEAESAKWMEIRMRIALEKRNRMGDMEIGDG